MMKTLLACTLMVGALASNSMAQCESSCSVEPQFLSLWVGIVGPPDEEEGTFTICNTSTGDDCPLISGDIMWFCPDIDVYPTNYTLNTGECVNVNVRWVSGSEFYCDILTGCGSVSVEGHVIWKDASDVPEAFKLADAYPNPFNPNTTISYSVPETQEATLSVFNTNGQLVHTLVNGMVERGQHKVVFDASSLASGVYICTLQTSNQTATKKMVLVK